ncbi:MAG: D-sedoheptulose 7-phosphate isomerase [Limisphaerales bacterium]|jgi:D-sedoheptulose 7-phosphate isomerase
MDNKLAQIKSIFSDSIKVKTAVMESETLVALTYEVAKVCADAFKADKKVFWCGNGGSAADSQHLAAEFSGRFYFDRDPLYSEALHVNTSYITAVGNDYGYDQIYSRLVKAKVREGDVLFGLSTSGTSINVVKAFEQARSQGGITIGMTGETGGTMKAESDHLFNIPSTDTPRIQECHMLIGHTICQLVEEMLFAAGK